MNACVRKKSVCEMDKETLKVWRKTSTKARLDWLDSALKFGKKFEKKCRVGER